MEPSNMNGTAAPQHDPQRASNRPTTGIAYRVREATSYRGVSKTSGTNTNLERYDVQCVFSDGGMKKHPKIYGFADPLYASRAFDLLICRRALEKDSSLSEMASQGRNLQTNHPLMDYTSPDLVQLLSTTSRDDIIYGLKAVAKLKFPLTKDSMFTSLKAGIDEATKEADARLKQGYQRQSYDATAPGPPSADRSKKRKIAKEQQKHMQEDLSIKCHGVGGELETNNKTLPLVLGPEGRTSVVNQKLRGGPSSSSSDFQQFSLLPHVADIQQLALAQLLATTNSSSHVTLPSFLNVAPISTTADAGPQRAYPSSLHFTNPTTTTTNNNNANNEMHQVHAHLDVGVDQGVNEGSGVSFIIELARLAGDSAMHGVHPELNCVADMVKIWDCIHNKRQNTKYEQQRRGGDGDYDEVRWQDESANYAVPSRFYQPHIHMIRETKDLPTFLSKLHDLWIKKGLHAILSAYISTLTVPSLLQATDETLLAGAADDSEQQQQQQNQEQLQVINQPEGFDDANANNEREIEGSLLPSLPCQQPEQGGSRDSRDPPIIDIVGLQ